MRKMLPLMGLLAACSGKDIGDTAGDDGAWAPTAFEAGQFQFTSYSVSDGCLDGSFSVLFLPEGDGTRSDWAYPIELPAWSSLPSSYSVQIQDPFSAMDVTVEEAGTGTLRVASAVQTDVEYDADNAPGCLVDMNIDVEIVLDDNDNVHGQAVMSTGSFDESSCPVVDADPCSIVLDFDGVRL